MEGNSYRGQGAHGASGRVAVSIWQRRAAFSGRGLLAIVQLSMRQVNYL